MATPYNPLAKDNLGVSIREALLKQTPLPLPPGKFKGAGIYALYYVGSFEQYRRVADQNKDDQFNCPIYVGKAVPEGSRKGGVIKDPQNSTALVKRLQQHAESIQAAANLNLEDFFFRSLVLDDIWIPLGETYMIEKFQPLWNTGGFGFGIKTPGSRRKGQYTSLWDMIHPGRGFVTKLGQPPNPKNVAQILKQVEDYFKMPPEEKAKVLVKDDGELVKETGQ